MRLNDEQIRLLTTKVKIGKCPNCGSEKDKLVSPDVYQLYSVDYNDLRPGGKIPFMPLLAARCPDCAYTMLFNLKDLGIVK